MRRLRRQVLWALGGLLLTGATLTCCVLPSLLVLLGAGTVVATIIQLMPGVVSLSQHSWAVFLLAGTMLVINSVQLQLSRNSACPSDPRLATRCRRSRRWAMRIHAAALVGYCCSLLITVAVPLLLPNR